MDSEIGSVLVSLREAAGLTQKQLALRLQSNQTRMSRLESGEGTLPDTLRYLDALGTDRAASFKATLTRRWVHLPRPSMRHPDIAALVEIEDGLTRLSRLIARTSSPRALRHMIGWRDSLLRDGAYLSSLEHRICYIGRPGVGKSTIVTQQMALYTTDSASIVPAPMLPIGGGRTTLCNIELQWSDRHTLVVEPLPWAEVSGFVRDLCENTWKAARATARIGAGNYHVRSEIERAIRNMASLARIPRTLDGSGATIPAMDPLLELARKADSVHELFADFMHRIRPWRRNKTRISIDGHDHLTCQATLRQLLHAINAGQHPDYPFPKRIRLTVPRVNSIAYRLVAVDTRPLDEGCLRTDLREYMADDRTIVVLCSDWVSAPELCLTTLLASVYETKHDASMAARTCLMVAAHSGQALSMRDEAGSNAESVLAGYAIKLADVSEALADTNTLPIEPFCFNAIEDTRHDLLQQLSAKVKGVRNFRLRQAKLRIYASDADADGIVLFESLLDALYPVLKADPVLLSIEERGLVTIIHQCLSNLSVVAIRSMIYRRDADCERSAVECSIDAIVRYYRSISLPILNSAKQLLEARIDKDNSLRIFSDLLVAGTDRQLSLFLDAVRYHAHAVFGNVIEGEPNSWAAWAETIDKRDHGVVEIIASEIGAKMLADSEIVSNFNQQVVAAWKLLIEGFVQGADDYVEASRFSGQAA